MNMLQWLCNILFKSYVEQLVDQCFEEKLVERRQEASIQQLKNRANAIRATLNNQVPIENNKEENEVFSSSRVQSGSAEPRIQKPPSQASIEKAAELDAMRAKLMGKKT